MGLRSLRKPQSRYRGKPGGRKTLAKIPNCNLVQIRMDDMLSATAEDENGAPQSHEAAAKALKSSSAIRDTKVLQKMDDAQSLPIDDKEEKPNVVMRSDSRIASYTTPISIDRIVHLYPLSNYFFGQKNAQPETEKSVHARLQRMRKQYAVHGIRRSVDAVLLVYDHQLPHVLLLETGNAYFKLPGGELSPGEDSMEGLKRLLNTQLGRTDGVATDWLIGDIVSQWWRPNFEQATYPYLPSHCTKPKEHKRVLLIHLPENAVFNVPRNFKLVAAPLFELYEKVSIYGPQIASLPLALSRFNFVYN